MSKRIFISHAVQNKELAGLLVDLLETGIGIRDEDIFCSSLESMGIPSGKNFVEFIRSEIDSPDVVILIISEQYYESPFCLCELGACWALSHRIIPLMVPPLTYANVKAVLTGIQVLKIVDHNDLNKFQQDLIDALSVQGKQFARWETCRNMFIERANALLKKNYDRCLSTAPQQNDSGKMCINGSTEKEKNCESLDYTASVEPNVSDFLRQLSNGEIPAEEVLLLKYIQDTGKSTLGIGWQTQYEQSDIQAWQEVNNLNNKLSQHYDAAHRRLKMRRVVSVSNTTESGKPKELAVHDSICQSLLNNPKLYEAVFKKVIEENKESASGKEEGNAFIF